MFFLLATWVAGEEEILLTLLFCSPLGLKAIGAGLFLDVKSAYPTVIKDRLRKRLTELSCPPYLTAIIYSFLSDRSTSMKMGDYTSPSFSIPEGLPQGSPLSVTLYLLYNSSLLIQNSASLSDDMISIGHVDDVVHLVAAPSVDKALSMLREEASRSLVWGHKYGAIFDRKKAIVMGFSPKPIDFPSFYFDGHTLKPQPSARWLGVILDSRLTFTDHIQKVKKTGELTLLQLGRITKSTFGLNLQSARRLVSAVLYPRILFGSLIWFTARNKKTVSQVLDGLFYKASRLITGLFKQTPLPFVKMSSGLKTLANTHTKLSLSYILKGLTRETPHPVVPFLLKELTEPKPSFPSPLHLFTGLDDLRQHLEQRLESIQDSPFPPWTDPVSEVFNLGIPKQKAVEVVQKQIDKEIEADALLIFTDGSLIPGTGAGAAAAALNCSFSDLVKISSHHLISNYESELIGIQLAIRLAKRIIWSAWPGRFKRIAIFGDNQGALMRTADPLHPSPGQHLYAYNFSSLRSLEIPVTLYWCPGHEGIEANERADSLAKSEAQHPEEDKAYAVLSRSTPASLSKMKRDCRPLWDNGPVLSVEEKKRYRFKLDPRPVIAALDE
jgi:ribonuclease HI